MMELLNIFLHHLLPQKVWNRLRKRRILRMHARIVRLCRQFLDESEQSLPDYQSSIRRQLDTSRIIWQYWAQGWDNVPEVVARCMASVNRFAGDYRVIRLSDENLEDYLQIPDFVQAKRIRMSTAHFSDIVRLMLLKTYGGLWLDATVYMSQPVPDYIRNAAFFVYRRCPDEPHQEFWENTYAYYFGWEPDFRVRILNSIMTARQENHLISRCCNLLLLWWQQNETMPDYFFFQILFDVILRGTCYETAFPLVSDCLPHYLQQALGPGGFPFMTREDILHTIPFHKLTYKQCANLTTI